MQQEIEELNDNMEQVFEQARKNSQTDKASEVMEKARTIMVMGKKPDHVFFATLVCRLRYLPAWDIGTAATDGERMFYNPDFILNKDAAGVRFVHAHEVMHCVLGHPVMFKTVWKHLDHQRLNIAADLVINYMLERAGYPPPDDALMPGKGHFKNIPAGLTTIETYRLLPEDIADQLGGDGDDPGGYGGVSPLKGEAGTEAAMSALEQQWKINTAQAANAAKVRGTVSAGLDLFINDLLKSKVNWREVLRDFLMRSAKTEYIWSPPNRRFISNGLYLPRLGGQTMAGLIIANDTSGSMDMGPRSLCAGEIQGICEQIGCELTILHHDSEVCSVQKWSPQEGRLNLDPKGGGGTDHRPVFQWVEDNAEEEVAAMICMTDLYSAFPDKAPSYPVLWCVIGNKTGVAPFGTTIHIEDEDQ